MTNINSFSDDKEYIFNLNVAERRLKLFKSSIKKILNLNIDDSSKVTAIISNLEGGYYQIPTTFNNDENIKKIQRQLLDARENSIFMLKSDFPPDKIIFFMKKIILTT